MNPVIIAHRIFKTYPHPVPTHVLVDLSLELLPGESVAISGRSGEGKTTLLHILGTLEQPDSGNLEIDGQQVTFNNRALLRRRSIGFIFQSFHLLEDCTALENVWMPAAIDRKIFDSAHGLALLDQVGLVDRAHFPVRLLSGGERQRVAIARALCNNPRLILADEPSGNLDASNREVIGKLLLSLTTTQGRGLILATHDPVLASLCNRQLILQGGKLIKVPSPSGPESTYSFN